MVGRGPKRSKSADSVVEESIASSSYSLEQVATHNSAGDCWMVINRKVGGDWNALYDHCCQISSVRPAGRLVSSCPGADQ